MCDAHVQHVGKLEESLILPTMVIEKSPAEFNGPHLSTLNQLYIYLYKNTWMVTQDEIMFIIFFISARSSYSWHS